MNMLRPLPLRRWVFFGSMAALALVVVGLTVQFQLHHRAEEIEAQFDAATLNARAFEDHLSQSFNVIDLTLVNAADMDPAQVTAAGASKGLTAALRLAPYLRSLALIDANGTIVASSNPRNLGRTVALGGFLPQPPDGAPALRVGPPWIGRDFADGRPSNPIQPASADAITFLPVAREVVLDDGRRVTLLAAVNGDFFVNHYGQALDSASATVDLLRGDGTLLLSTDATRWPGGAQAVTARLAQRPFGSFEQRLANGSVVTTAYRASRAYPFVIVVELDQDQVLAPWRTEAAGSLAVVMALLLAAMAVASGYYVRLERSAQMRAAAEAAVRVSEAQHRNTFETAAVGIAHASPQGRLLRCNPHLCEMLGYSAQELAQKTIADITHPDDMVEDRALKQRLLSGEIAFYRFEKRYLRRSGEPVWVRVTVSLARDAAGRVEYMPAIVEDIHLRKLTHVALETLNTDLTGDAFLRQTTRTLATLLGVEAAFVGVASPASTRRFDARAVCVDGEFVPDFSYDLAGTPCETVTGNALCVYAGQVQQQFPGDEMLATMGIESYAAVPLGKTTAEGAPMGVLAIMSRHPLRHIEAVETLLPLLALRVGTELVREAEARKFRDLFDGSPNAIFLIDRQSKIRMSSRAGERLFGWEPQGLRGQTLGLLFPSDRRPAYEALFRRFVETVFSGPINSGSKDMWGQRRDGSTFPAQVQLRTLNGTDGRMTVAHVLDITARLQSQDALRQHNDELETKVAARTVELSRARDEAEQANRAKSAFLAAMSHEIRTPMNGVVGMIDVLEQSNLRSTQAEIVKTIRESAHALLTIVDDVLDFSKIEAGHFQIDSEPMDVAGVVEGVCDTLDQVACRHGVELTLFTDPAIPAQLLGDAARLRQVLLNLAGNAIKFSSAQGHTGRVCVRACVVEPNVQNVVLEFSVVDNGIGIDAPMLSRLFTAFSQADASTTRRFGGTGLGLSISHGLVEMMGGTIGVRSEPGRGSTFAVRLALTPLPAKPARDDPAPDLAFDLAGLHCLVLGGAQGPAEDLSVYLAHSGALVHRATTWGAALQWFGTCAPGLWIGVLTDTDPSSHERAQAAAWRPPPGATKGPFVAPGVKELGSGPSFPCDALAELRAVCASRPNLAASFVRLERGQRRGPRIEAADLVCLDRDVMHRSVFLKAVALAAGRLTADALEPPSFGQDTMPAPLLSMQEASAQGSLILVAEDNEINQLVLRKQLTLLGYAAHIARNGREALECSQLRDYALLLTDLHMPVMDGYALAAAIRAAEAGERRMPIVALTANALQSEARRCHELGMDDYMTKPVQLANLKAMLRKWLPAMPTRTSVPDRPVPALPAAAAPTLALDVRVLEALVGDEPHVVEALLQDFRVSAGQASVQMRAACQDRQPDAVGAVAHRLKSSARAVGALALGELCAEMEQAGQAGQLDTLAHLWPRFEAEMAAVDKYLEAAQA